MIKHYCDRCATQITDHRDGLITANTGEFRLRIVVSVWNKGLWEDPGHLCQSCVRELIGAPAVDPETKSVTLCTHPERRDGEVTVGESRVAVAGVVGLIRAHGVEEARLVWPQLTDAELQVLERIGADLDHEHRDTDEDARKLVVVCGSTSDEGRLAAAAAGDRLAGNLVYVPRPDSLPPDDLDREHLAWIDRADEVLVVCKHDGSTGESTTAEVKYAQGLGKPLRWWPETGDSDA